MKDEKNIEKRAYRGEAERKIITNRINRIEGQLHGIKKMIHLYKYQIEYLAKYYNLHNEQYQNF